MAGNHDAGSSPSGAQAFGPIQSPGKRNEEKKTPRQSREPGGGWRMQEKVTGPDCHEGSDEIDSRNMNYIHRYYYGGDGSQYEKITSSQDVRMR